MTVRELIEKLSVPLMDGTDISEFTVLVSESPLTKVRAVSIVVDMRDGRNEVAIV